ncbi:MAG: pantetheine-phosphate adenylyltransferase [Candidatus Marinimicrobia bacterium]|nr:pantetheine-phosphate adenylyltransferase [Candidatus Neomarinimicrobiota bacterium]
MKNALYPGTFDPITNGHIDILNRAASIFDHVHIAVARNLNKQPFFSAEERVQLIKDCTLDFKNISVDFFDGLVVNYAEKIGATVIIRGLRAISDFEFEFQMALMNRKLKKDIDSVFFMPSVKNSYLSSSVVREIALFDGNIREFVPVNVEKALKDKLRSIK